MLRRPRSADIECAVLLVLAVLFLSLGACSFDWDLFDPRLQSGSAGGGGQGGGQGGQGGAAGGGAGGIGGGGAGGGEARRIGCSDGERDAYLDSAAQPNIAGCSGGFDVPGLTTVGSRTPACDRQAGDDGQNPEGVGCSVEDLCAEGWAVCNDAMEVASASATGECPPPPDAPAIWITRQGGPAMSSAVCDATGSDNLTGCGASLGSAPGSSCAPLDQQLLYDDCVAATAWECGPDTNRYVELDVVTKTGPAEGGVLCCRQDA